MFKVLEKNFDVDSVRHNGVSIWPIVKSYGIDLLDETKLIKQATSSTLRILCKSLFLDFFALKNLWKSPYWVFTNSERRYYINNVSFDRVTTGLLRYIGSYVLFENPIPKGRTPRSRLSKGEYKVGMSWFFLAQFLLLKLTRVPRIDNLNLLESYLGQNLLRLKKIYHRICAGEAVYNWLILLFKPKVIFVVCYYSNFELIKAAKKNKIPVVELQHGLITKNHRAYFFKKKQENSLLPDYFLSYGKYFSKILSNGNVVSSENIIQYGYSFLEYVDRELKASEGFKSIQKPFAKTICITGQLEVTNQELLQVVTKVCDNFPDVGFFYKPRFSDDRLKFVEKQNFKVVTEHNTYELLKFCDYHMTVYSTCALESIALGTPNISVDIKGYYSKHMKHLLEANPYNFECSSQQDLRKLLHTLVKKKFTKIEIQKSISDIFSTMIPAESFLDFFQKVVKDETNH